MRVLAAALLAAAVVSAARAPEVGGVVARAAGEAAHRIRTLVFGAPPVHAVAVTATSESLAHPAGAAVDTFKNRYWAESSPGDGTGEALTLQFAEPFELAYVVVLNGGVPPDVAFTAHPRPRKLRFESDTGAVRVVELEDHPEPQELQLHLPVTAQLIVRILTVYPSAGDGHDAAISELAFYAGR